MDKRVFVERASRISFFAPASCGLLALALFLAPNQRGTLIAAGFAVVAALAAGVVFAVLAAREATRLGLIDLRSTAIFAAAFNGVFLLGLVGAYGMRVHAKGQWNDEIAYTEQSAMDSYLRYDGWVGVGQFPWGEAVIANIPDDSPFYAQLRDEGMPEVKLFFARADHTRGSDPVTIDVSTSVFQLDKGVPTRPTEAGISNAQVMEMIAPEARHRWHSALQGTYEIKPGKSLSGVFLFGDASLLVEHVKGIQISVNGKPAVVTGRIMPAQMKERLADQRLGAAEAARDAGSGAPDASTASGPDAQFAPTPRDH